MAIPAMQPHSERLQYEVDLRQLTYTLTERTATAALPAAPGLAVIPSLITAGAYDMSWRFFAKPLSCLCCVVSGPRLAFRQHLRISAHETVACGNHASGLVIQRSRRALTSSKLERRGWRLLHAYPSTNKLASGTPWLQYGSRHVFQETSRLDAKSEADKLELVPGAHGEVQKQLTMDYTALVASTQELKTYWTPAKVSQVGKCSQACSKRHLLAGTGMSCSVCKATSKHSASDSEPFMEIPGCTSAGTLSLAAYAQAHNQPEALLLKPSLLVKPL